MKRIFVDTETTGYRPGYIVQLSYIVEENNNLKAKNRYFKVPYVEKGAEEIHGLSIKLLDRLSEGKWFGYHASDIYNDLKEGQFIAHNVNFDENFIKTELQRYGYLWTPKERYCTMQNLKNTIGVLSKNNTIKNPKLEEAMNYYNIAQEEVLSFAQRLFNCVDISFHDSRFDVAGLYLVYNNIGQEKGLF